MGSTFERTLDNLIGPKAIAIEAFLKHLDRMGHGHLYDVEMSLKMMQGGTFYEHAGIVATDALTTLDPTTLTILREFAATFSAFDSWLQKAVLFALLELALSEFMTVQFYWTKKFKFVTFEVIHA